MALEFEQQVTLVLTEAEARAVRMALDESVQRFKACLPNDPIAPDSAIGLRAAIYADMVNVMHGNQGLNANRTRVTFKMVKRKQAA